MTARPVPLTRLPGARSSPALEPIYGYIARLPEPDRTLFVLELQRFLDVRPAGATVKIREAMR